VEGTIEGVDGARDDHRRETGMELFGATNEFVAVHLRHDEVAEDEVDATGKSAFEKLKGVLRVGSGNDAIATGFQEKGAN
jgi:hypothetical protein